ncbi:Uncharacterised protein [Mycobacteroides abscessus subsp. abscessus]|uniref:hypothetical protein n=1 Tax=Mycobacteroides abscessus TaxID=36809 RepID=UPI0009283316|nr:hypothetical protein [Mycobacteroides abscessus]SHP28830.1 Uncharacterised protein [Mycobacteroides abscessus subsp. abscessus]SHP69018.1 Uncharacterised protein [Mycobacteroides abscessus subsp. abscessus]SHY39377.1 Uncharacterised protein [Mycobacteroides abscessus subsp. abscessus]SKD93429.1 Uncharacterised protein [Mycobacteroides abscessus subsp. abscessus]
MPPRFRETWVPFCLDELTSAESIPLSDPDSFIPYLTERWPEGGRPHRVELQRDGRPNPRGVDGYVVFRVPPPPPEESGKRKVKVDWAQLRPKVPPKKRKPQEE